MVFINNSYFLLKNRFPLIFNKKQWYKINNTFIYFLFYKPRCRNKLNFLQKEEEDIFLENLEYNKTVILNYSIFDTKNSNHFSNINQSLEKIEIFIDNRWK